MEDEPIKKVVAEMQKTCAFIKWLGSYPISDNT